MLRNGKNILMPLNVSRYCLCRHIVDYTDTLPSGEKMVMDKEARPGFSGKKEPWQRVRYKGKEPELLKIKDIEKNERLCAIPDEARQIAYKKMQSMKDKLVTRGFCREINPYQPPSDVLSKLEQVYTDMFGKLSDDWQHESLRDTTVKYKFLTRCIKEFAHEVPNSKLHLITTVGDVIDFYSTPIRGINSYEQLVRTANANNLPKNLHVIGEPIRYNPEHDTFFKGYNAYPHTALNTVGLRAKKKYPSFKSTFQWPDI